MRAVGVDRRRPDRSRLGARLLGERWPSVPGTAGGRGPD